MKELILSSLSRASIWLTHKLYSLTLLTYLALPAAGLASTIPVLPNVVTVTELSLCTFVDLQMYQGKSKHKTQTRTSALYFLAKRVCTID